VKKFPTFNGTPTFINRYKTAPHLFLSSAMSSVYALLSYFFNTHFNIIFPSVYLPRNPFHSDFLTNSASILALPAAYHILHRISFSSVSPPKQYLVNSTDLFTGLILLLPSQAVIIFLSTLGPYVLTLMKETIFHTHTQHLKL